MADISRTWWRSGATGDNKRVRIEDVIQPGMHLMVQCIREPEGKKGAAMTTHISLPGRFVVLLPDAQRSGGVSRRIEDESKRRRLKELLGKLGEDSGYSLIIRTVGITIVSPLLIGRLGL